MIELTDTARLRYDDYLRRMRTALGERKADTTEIEHSVREHVEVALAGVPGPVAEEELSRVLERLGPPERWVGEEPPKAWRRIIDRIQHGPDDWRVSYLSFGLFLLTFVFPPFLLASYVASRAYIELMRDSGRSLGARRWLVYPPLVLLLAFLTVVAIIGPAGPLMAIGIDDLFDRFFEVPHGDIGRATFYAGAGAVVFGAWWMLLAGICSILLRPIRFSFAPLLDNLKRRHFAVLSVIGTLVAAIGALILYQLY